MRLLKASAFLAILVIFTCTLTIDCRLSTSANESDMEGDRPNRTFAYAKTSAGIVRGYTSYVAGIHKPAKVFKVTDFRIKFICGFLSVTLGSILLVRLAGDSLRRATGWATTVRKATKKGAVERRVGRHEVPGSMLKQYHEDYFTAA